MDVLKRVLLTTSALCIAAIVSSNFSIVDMAQAGGGVEKPWKGGTKVRKKKPRKKARKRAVRKKPVGKKRAVKRPPKKKRKAVLKGPTKAERDAYQAYKTSVRKRQSDLIELRKKLKRRFFASVNKTRELKKAGKDGADNFAYQFHERRASVLARLYFLLNREVSDLSYELDGLRTFKQVNKKPLDAQFRYDRTTVQTFISAYEQDLKAHVDGKSPKVVIDHFKKLVEGLKEIDSWLKAYNDALRSLSN